MGHRTGSRKGADPRAWDEMGGLSCATRTGAPFGRELMEETERKSAKNGTQTFVQLEHKENLLDLTTWVEFKLCPRSVDVLGTKSKQPHYVCKPGSQPII